MEVIAELRELKVISPEIHDFSLPLLNIENVFPTLLNFIHKSPTSLHFFLRVGSDEMREDGLSHSALLTF